jgi:hypothetical protein
MKPASHRPHCGSPGQSEYRFVCALGRLTGPQDERGVFRTTDGGEHWERVLFVDKNTGCSGLSMDAKNPQKLFAGTWQVEMHTYGELSGGPGSGVYMSRDGGSTWNRVTDGLPKSTVGKTDVAVAPSNSDRVYAMIQTADQGSMWRSYDGGVNWRVVNWDRALIGRAGYYIHLAVSPVNDNEVLVANSSFHRSLDGGETFRPENGWGATLTTSGGIPRTPIGSSSRARRRDEHHITTSHGRGFHRATLPIRPDVSRVCRQSKCRMTSTPTCRIRPPCAAPRYKSALAGSDAQPSPAGIAEWAGVPHASRRIRHPFSEAHPSSWKICHTEFKQTFLKSLDSGMSRSII